MKKLLGGKILLILVCVLLGCVSCMNDGGSDWVGKWQLRECQYPDGTVQRSGQHILWISEGEFSGILYE